MDKYELIGNGAFSRVVQKTIFRVKNKEELNPEDLGILFCVKCGEELGEVTDENIDHQSEYHSCATKEMK